MLGGLTWQIETSDKRITGVTRRTGANSSVVDRFAPRLDATGSGARVAALLVDTSQDQRAFGADCAFWSARRWTAQEFGQTRAHRLSIDRSALTVWSAGRRVAGITDGLIDFYKE